MKHRKLKSYVLPTLYVIVLMLVFGTVSLVSTLFSKSPDYLFSVGIMKNMSKPVMNTNTPTGVTKPFKDGAAKIKKNFYDLKGTEEEQANALIFYEGTYMKNTGTLYSSEEKFDVLSVLDGTVLSVSVDEALGTTVQIEHNTNLRTVYYLMDSASVKEGDAVVQGMTIGTSGPAKINKEEANNLLFEVYLNGSLVNPEEFYSMDTDNLN